MDKRLVAIAFLVLLLVPVGAQNAFAQICPLIPGCTTGNLYVADSNTVRQYDSTGALLNANFAPGVSSTRGIAFDSAGNLYVANLGLGTVEKYDSTGALLDASFITGLSLPTAIAFDSAGNLYVGNNGFDTVSQYDSAGTLLNANFVTGLSLPTTIAFDSAGNLYVVDAALNTVGQYDTETRTPAAPEP